MGLLPQPCFFSGRGFNDIICFAWNELDNDFRCILGFDPMLLCFVGGATDMLLAFTWLAVESTQLAPEIPEKGIILWRRI